MPPNFAGVDYDTAGQLFLTGRAAMLIGGSFDIAAYKALNPAANFDFIAPPSAKAGDPPEAAVFYDGGYAVNAASPNKDAALKLVNWMGTPAFGNKFSALLGNISPIKGVDHLRPAARRAWPNSMPRGAAAYQRRVFPLCQADGVGDHSRRHPEADGGLADSRSGRRGPDERHWKVVPAFPGQVRHGLLDRRLFRKRIHARRYAL